jgi:hypothetical protein
MKATVEVEDHSINFYKITKAMFKSSSDLGTVIIDKSNCEIIQEEIPCTFCEHFGTNKCAKCSKCIK